MIFFRVAYSARNRGSRFPIAEVYQRKLLIVSGNRANAKRAVLSPCLTNSMSDKKNVGVEGGTALLCKKKEGRREERKKGKRAGNSIACRTAAGIASEVFLERFRGPIPPGGRGRRGASQLSLIFHESFIGRDVTREPPIVNKARSYPGVGPRVPARTVDTYRARALHQRGKNLASCSRARRRAPTDASRKFRATTRLPRRTYGVIWRGKFRRHCRRSRRRRTYANEFRRERIRGFVDRANRSRRSSRCK